MQLKIKSSVCFLLYKKYLFCELTNNKFDTCQPAFDNWYNYCFFERGVPNSRVAANQREKGKGVIK